MGVENLPVYRHEGRGLGVVFENITAHGKGGGIRTVLDLPAIFEGAVNLPVDLVRRFAGNRQSTKIIIHDISGVVFPGETLLVLGQPGSGCSTTLKILANERASYAKVDGDVSYSSISAETMGRKYGSEVIYNAEDDIHYPNLKVKHTLDFALRLRKPAKQVDQTDAAFSGELTDRLLGSLGMMHTKDTIVGNSFVRGVSGGERKRVSLAEVMATNPAVACWDNPIRGLDSSSALQFLRLLKEISTQTHMTNIVTLYQASESMYSQCFDRVLVMYEGKMIFSGKAEDAKNHFIDLGFHMWDRQTTPDFLTAVTAPSERVVRQDHKGPVPSTPDQFADAFCSSPYFEKLQTDIRTYHQTALSDTANLVAFQDEVHRVQSAAIYHGSLQPMPIWSQSLVAARRYYQLLWKNQRDLYIVLFLNAVNAVINGSAYFMAPKTATGSFEKGGAIFFSLIYFFLNALAEVSSTINARSILVKQHKLGIIHPVAFVIAQTIADIPVAIFQSLVFSCCYYFMLGLHRTASDFWIFELVLFTHYCAVSSLFRMLGAWAPSLNIAFFMAGTAMPICLTYAGYGPPVPTMHRWGSWIKRISPSPWALEALMGNEFADITLHCTPDQMIPHGPRYDDIQYQGCSLAGSVAGSNMVPGSTYLGIVYNFYRSHLWRNWGIIVVMWFIYVLLTAIGLTIMTGESGSTGGPVFKRSAALDTSFFISEKAKDDLEHNTARVAPLEPVSSSSSVTRAEDAVIDHASTKDLDETKSQRTFSFRDVSYYVQVDGNEKQLLNGVSGYVKPGQLTALMGASGAGKTTLLDTISQRKSTGRVEGEMLLGGKPLGGAFSRSCGFCMQQDVHEPFATVREALEFSAKLRQSKEIPTSEKLSYVDNIISLLELEPIADALIGEPGDGGLNVEERKRVTIGVELAAKPSALLFLDEPTSGLDSQAAFSIVSFLKKIAEQGVPIVCTIHQPSAILFQMFDHVLLLAPGGRTVYFGETGPESKHAIDYFARNGANMGASENPAEFIISTVTSKQQSARDWPQIWNESEECSDLQRKLASLESELQLRSEDESPSLTKNARYALPLWDQILELTKRQWMVVWRNGPYNFSKLFKCIFCELFIAFSYFHAGPDVQGLQNYMLALLIIVWIIPATAADIQNVWFGKWAVFEARERNGIYDYKALLVAITLVEIPWQALGYTLVYFCIYWTVGYPNATSIAGYVYFMFLILSLFATSFCHLMAAIFPNPTLAGYANSLFWVVLTVFSGTLVPHSAMNTFYRYWIFWVDPLRYFLGGTVSNALHGVKAHCKESDLTIFHPPSGSTCYNYAADFLRENSGHLTNPNATSSCGYCKFSYGDDFAATLDYYQKDRWRDWAVLLGWCFANMLGIWFFTWLYRIKLHK